MLFSLIGMGALIGVGASAQAAGLTINEVLVNPPGADADQEWIEIYNGSDADIDVGGWTIQWGTSAYTNETLLDAGSLAPGAVWLIGGSAVPGTNQVASFNFGNAGSSADAIRLMDPESVVADTLVYGSPNSDAWLDDGGAVAESLAAKPGDGAALGAAVAIVHVKEGTTNY